MDALPRYRDPSTCMQRLDRLEWAAGLAVDAYGIRVGVRVNTPDILDHVRACLPPGSKPIEGPWVDHLYSLRVGGSTPDGRGKTFTLLYAGVTRIARTHYVAEALQTLETEVGRAVAGLAREYVFVHAGVVGWRGRAILLPGRSTAGKSTLVRTLIDAGATYYSDEYAVLNRHGQVLPYSRELALRLPHSTTMRCSAVSLGGTVGETPLPIGLIAFTEYREGATWRPRPMSVGQTVWELAGNSMAALDAPAEAMPFLECAASKAVRLRGRRGEAASVVPALLATCAESAESPPTQGIENVSPSRA